MKSSLTIATCCAAIAGAVPFSSRHRSILPRAPQYTDPQLLNNILSLEHFQDAFYRQGVANFTQAQFAEAGFNSDFYLNLTDIASHEHTHVTSLTTSLLQLNVTPVAECSYYFNVTSPQGFVQAATLIESVSVSSYIGLLAKLHGAAYQTLFSSVLAVEARHSSFIRASLGLQPFATPFDTPLDLDEAYTLTQLYTLSCPQENPLALKNFPTLSSSFSNHAVGSLGSKDGGMIGEEVLFITYGKDIKVGSDCEPIYAAFLTITGPVFSPTIRVPENGGFKTTVPAPPKGYAPINGFVHVVLSSSNTTLTDDNILAGPASIEIWPK
ncbi:MAG: hypothetical protein Q9228_005721 [Teloschistes exilis]